MVWGIAGIQPDMSNTVRNSSQGFRFTIRLKLLLLSIVILVIPYIGYEYMRELERNLRVNLETSLIDAARAIAGPLHENYQLFPYIQTELQKTLFIHNLDTPIQIDGYTDDWINYQDWMDSFSNGSLLFKLILGQRDQYLYVLLQVKDDKLVYHQPSSERTIDSDYVELLIGDDYQVKERYYFAPSAPGRFNPFQVEKKQDEWEEREYTRYITNVLAEWQPVKQGYNLEIALPLNMINERMGFIVGDVDSEETNQVIRKTGTAGKETETHPGRLIRPSNNIVKLIRHLDNTPGRRIWVLDSQGQVLASAGSLKRELPMHPLNIFYKFILPPVTERFQDDLAGASRLQGEEVRAALLGKTESRWRSSPDNKAVIVSAAAPVWISGYVRGVVVAEETTNNIQMLQRNALVNLVNKTMVLFVLIILLLLAFATRLSMRLRTLSQQAASTIDHHGRVIGTISASTASDEIGDLSRSYSAMLDKLRQYNKYLESMTGKLSHELRTPMAIVQSSLDNLQTGIRDSEKIYLDRAREGIQRLNLLVTRLSEAARLEHALQSTDLEPVDICQLVTQAVNGYRMTYTDVDFRLEIPDKPLVVHLAPDLVLQMLDKLIANAMDFSMPSSPIEIRLTDQADRINLDVINYGQTLPDEMGDQLFNSMISVRNTNNNGKLHLGLGLYISRLIAEFHGGEIMAHNLDDKSGVCFTVIIRLARKIP